MSSRSLAITLAVLALLALVLRVIRLDERPPHTDEAVNAWILGRVLTGEPFAFDPRDRHGPLLPAVGLATALMLGRRTFADLDERTIRLAPAIVGAAATGLFLLGSGLIPNGVLASGAALWAVSPLPLYYARYAIHETLLVAATLAFLLMLVRALAATSPRAQSAWAAGAGVAAGTMLAAKLTAVIPFLAAGVALAGCSLASAHAASDASKGDRKRTVFARVLLAIGAPLAVAAAVTVAFAYSWGFTRFAGLHDLVFGLEAPLARAAGQGHGKGPLYFFSILGTRGAGVLLLLGALAGSIIAWRRGSPVARGLVIYAVVLLGVHSAIPYKTPWLALGIFLPLALLAGWAVDAALQVGRALRARRDDAVSPAARSESAPYLRIAAWLGLFAFAGLTAHADYRLVYAEPAAESNPLAYAHTSPDLRRLVALVDSLPVSEPLIAVSLNDPWPLPFLLRRESQVGFWQPGQALPAEAAVVITTPEDVSTLDPHFAAWRPHYFSQRPGVMLVALQNPNTEAAP